MMTHHVNISWLSHLKKKRGMCQPRSSHIHPPAPSPAALPCSAGPTPWPTVPPAAPRRAALVPAPRCCRTWGQRPGQGVAKRGTNVEQMWKIWEKNGNMWKTDWKALRKLGFGPKSNSFQKLGGEEKRWFGWNTIFVWWKDPQCCARKQNAGKLSFKVKLWFMDAISG